MATNMNVTEGASVSHDIVILAFQYFGQTFQAIFNRKNQRNSPQSLMARMAKEQVFVKPPIRLTVNMDELFNEDAKTVKTRLDRTVSFLTARKKILQSRNICKAYGRVQENRKIGGLWADGSWPQLAGS